MPETRPPAGTRRPLRLGPLDGVALPERREVEGAVDIALAVPRDVSLVSAEARRGRSSEMAELLAARFGAMPQPGQSHGEAPRLLHTAPDTLLAVSEDRMEGALAAELREALGGTASVVDQSHGRTLIRLGGPQARALLAYGTGIDLAPERFPPGACAATMLGHIAASVHLRSAAPEFDLIVARAFAESLWDWLLGRARRFGYEVKG